MSRIENIDHPKGMGSRILNSKFADVAREILPERVKITLRQVVRREKAHYPLPEPIVAGLDGVEARFYIKNHSDWYRIGTNDFEGNYGVSLLQTIKSKDKPYVVDVGAAQGYYSILAAKVGARVIAIDPDPISQRSLAENISLNEDVQDRIHPLSVALGHTTGETTLYIDEGGTYAPSLARTVRGLKQKIQVPVQTMDELVFHGIIPSPEVVKIDVEGAEGLVASEVRPSDIFIELHTKYLPRFGTTTEKVAQSIANQGYSLTEYLERRSEILCHYQSL
jgi:FkbM family methyltransferase